MNRRLPDWDSLAAAIARGPFLCVAGLILAAPTAPAQRDEAPGIQGAPTIQEAQETTGSEKETNRILFLTDGSILRGRTRAIARDAGQVANGATDWELRTASGWRRVEAEHVERVALERDSLSRARALERELPQSEPDKRVQLADWMLREGLSKEALEQLDRVLGAAPDHALALALLAHPPVPLRISLCASDDPSALFEAALSAPPAAREMVLARLGQLEDGQSLRARLREALRGRSPRVRALAAQGWKRLCPGEAVTDLVARAVLDGSEDVRRASAQALKAVGNEAVILPAVRALDSRHASVRSNAIRALGDMGYPAAVPALMSRLASVTAPAGAASSASTLAGSPRSHIFVGRQFAYVQDYDVEVAQGAAVADPIVNTAVEGAVLDVRVIGINDVTVAQESLDLRRSLATLVGQDRSARAWLQWWNEHASEYAPRRPGDGPTTTGG